MSKEAKENISAFQAAVMAVNIMVGAGVLAGPGIMAAAAGGASFLGWTLAALILIPIVYNISRLPEAMPGAGGIYLYCKEGLGTFGGYVGGWLYFLCYNFAVTAVLSAFRLSFLTFYPDMWALQNKFVFLLICLSIVFGLNLLSASTAATIQSSLTYFKLVPVFAAIALLPLFISKGISISWGELSNVHKAIPLAIFGFFGFEYCCNISHMVRGGAAAAKKSILASFLFVAGLYTLFHFSVLVIMGTHGLATFQASGYAAFVGQKFPIIATILAFILPVATIVTYMNSTNGIVFLDAILLHTLAEDRMIRFSEFFRTLNGSGRPWVCVLISVLFSLFAGTLIESTSSLAVACNLCICVLLTTAIVALLKFEWHKPFDFNRLAGIVGIVVGLCLAVFNWTQIAPTNYERLLAAVPIFIGLCAGLLLFNPSAKPSGLDEMASDEAMEIEQNK